MGKSSPRIKLIFICSSFIDEKGTLLTDIKQIASNYNYVVKLIIGTVCGCVVCVCVCMGVRALIGSYPVMRRTHSIASGETLHVVLHRQAEGK